MLVFVNSDLNGSIAFILRAGNSDGRIGELALAGDADAAIAVVVGCEGGFFHKQVIGVDAVAFVVAADVGGRAVHDLDIGTIDAAALGAVGDSQGAVVHQNIQRFQANDAGPVAFGFEGGAIGDVDEVGAVFVALAFVNAVPCNGIVVVFDGQGGVVVHIENAAAAASHVDALCACVQTCAIHGEIGAVQR